MADLLRGEIDLKGASGKLYRFKLGTRAICSLEQTLDRPVLALYADLKEGTMRLTALREFVKASALPDPIPDEDANAILDDVGTIPALSGLLDSLIATFNLEDKIADGKKKAAGPRKPARGGLNATSGDAGSKSAPN